MANIDWAKNIKSEPFGNLLNLYRGSSVSAAPSAQTTEESFLGKAIAEAKRNGVILDSSTIGNLALVGALSPSKQPGFSEPGGEKEKLDYWAQLQKEQALERQRLGKESTAEAFKYKMLQQGIDKIGNAFNPYGSKEGALAYAAHLSSLPGIASETMRSIPMMNVQGVAYNAPQRQYFT